MKSKYRFISVIIYCMLLGTVACASFSRQFPEKKFYLLELPKEVNSPLGKGAVLKVRRFSISPRFDTKEFVYRRSEVLYESDFYNLFFISPSTNIREELVSYLLQKQVFDWDASQQSKLDPTHFLEANIQELYGDFRGSTPKAVLTIDLILYTEKNGGTQVISKKTYTREIPLETSTAESLALGWKRALFEILGELSSDWKNRIKVE